MSERNPNPNDWNRGYTVGTGKGSVMSWLGIGLIVFVFGAIALSYLFD